MIITRIFRRLKHRLFWTSIFITCVFLLAVLYYLDHSHTREIEDQKFLLTQQHKELLLLRRNLEFLKSPNISKNQLMCVHPKLQLWNPEILNQYSKLDPLKCTPKEQNWVYTRNGSFYISGDVSELHGGHIECDVTLIERQSDDQSTQRGETIKQLRNETVLKSDVFEAKCLAKDGKSSSMVLLGVAPKQEVKGRATLNKHFHKTSLNLDILIVGFDSVSQMCWQRNLPKTYEYFTRYLGGVVLEGYNIVGDGTVQAVLPILTGKTETELPEGRRGFTNATQVDNNPWIWNDLKKLGYATQWGEDASHIGTFTYRLLGFKNAPVDHYMRPFYLAAESQYSSYQKYCLGSIPRHKLLMDYMKDFCDVYSSQRKFSFLFHNEYSHDSISELQYADHDLVEHLRYLKDRGHLDNALLVLMSDHGARFQGVRASEQGKHEERMPFFSLRLPKRFLSQYPDIAKNLKINAHRLTTPFDIHATLKDIVDFRSDKVKLSEDPTEPLPRGISLFGEVPKRRSCIDAGIDPHWCSCLSWEPILLEDPVVIPAASAVLQKINLMTSDERELCQELKLDKILSAVRYTSSDSVLRFKKTKDIHGRVPDFSDAMSRTKNLYQVTFITKPGEAKFEATVTQMLDSGNMIVDDKSISRINRYADQPHCVARRVPHLRPYCFCKLQLKST